MGEGKSVTFPDTTGRPRATRSDYLRALAYFAFVLWAVLFAYHPPTVFAETIDSITRSAWMAITCLGAIMATMGAVLRIDLKLELPGLGVLMLGPVFYSLSQLYYVLFVPLSSNANNRIALIVYALIPALLMLPRMVELWSEARRAKRIAVQRAIQLVKGGN